MASEVLRQADAGALDPPLSAHPGSPPAQTSHCNRQSPGRGGSRPSKYHKLSYFRDFSSAAFASLPLQIFHPNSKIRSLCLQDRWPQLADDQEGMFRTLHPPTSLPLSHFCYPSECHQAFFFFLSLTKQQRKKYYRKLCNGKGFCKIHNSKPQFFFFPHCAPALCNRPLFVTDFKENVCSSKISRFLVNCQKDFFFFIASGKIQKE